MAVLCSGCTEEIDIVIEDLDDVEREACCCGYSVVVLSVVSFDPVYAEVGGELVELAPRSTLSLAA